MGSFNASNPENRDYLDIFEKTVITVTHIYLIVIQWVNIRFGYDQTMHTYIHEFCDNLQEIWSLGYDDKGQELRTNISNCFKNILASFGSKNLSKDYDIECWNNFWKPEECIKWVLENLHMKDGKKSLLCANLDILIEIFDIPDSFLNHIECVKENISQILPRLDCFLRNENKEDTLKEMTGY